MKQKALCTALLPLFCGGVSGLSTPATDPALIAARGKFFGPENVDATTGAVAKDKVIFAWATNATLAASILGRVVLLDSYINRPEVPPTGDVDDLRRSPMSPDDMVAMKPEAIFLGHGHGDHADNAAYIAKLSGATIYAGPET